MYVLIDLCKCYVCTYVKIQEKLDAIHFRVWHLMYLCQRFSNVYIQKPYVVPYQKCIQKIAIIKFFIFFSLRTLFCLSSICKVLLYNVTIKMTQFVTINHIRTSVYYNYVSMYVYRNNNTNYNLYRKKTINFAGGCADRSGGITTWPIFNFFILFSTMYYESDSLKLKNNEIFN